MQKMEVGKVYESYRHTNTMTRRCKNTITTVLVLTIIYIACLTTWVVFIKVQSEGSEKECGQMKAQIQNLTEKLTGYENTLAYLTAKIEALEKQSENVKPEHPSDSEGGKLRLLYNRNDQIRRRVKRRVDGGDVDHAMTVRPVTTTLRPTTQAITSEEGSKSNSRKRERRVKAVHLHPKVYPEDVTEEINKRGE